MLKHAFKQTEFSLAEILEWLYLVSKHDIVILHWTIWSTAVGSVEKLGSTWRGKFEVHQDSVKLRRPCLKARLFKWSCKAGKKKRGGGLKSPTYLYSMQRKDNPEIMHWVLTLAKSKYSLSLQHFSLLTLSHEELCPPYKVSPIQSVPHTSATYTSCHRGRRY